MRNGGASDTALRGDIDVMNPALFIDRLAFVESFWEHRRSGFIRPTRQLPFRNLRTGPITHETNKKSHYIAVYLPSPRVGGSRILGIEPAFDVSSVDQSRPIRDWSLLPITSHLRLRNPNYFGPRIQFHRKSTNLVVLLDLELFITTFFTWDFHFKDTK